MTKIPKYIHVRNIVSKRISDGLYEVGSAIPTEVKFAEEFKIHRHTIRKALTELVENGLIKRSPRSGTVVMSRSAVSAKRKTIVEYRFMGRKDPGYPKYSALNKLIQEFMEENPDIEIKLEPLQGEFSTTPEYIAGVHSYPHPAIVTMHYTADAAGAGYLLPLESFTDFSEVTSAIEGRLIGRYFGSEGGKKVYSLPLNSGSRMMLVNMSLFKRLGFSEADFPETRQEFLALCKLILKNKSGVKPLDFDMAYGTQTFTRFLPYVLSAEKCENRMYADDKSVNLTTEGCRAFAEFLRQLFDCRCFSNNQEEQNFFDGRAVFFFSGIMNSIDVTERKIPDCEIRSIPFPRFDIESEHTTVIHGEYAAILKNSIHSDEEKEAAWRFLKFLISYKTQKLLCEKLEMLPSRTDLYASVEKCRPAIKNFYDYGSKYGCPYIDVPGNYFFNKVALKTFLQAAVHGNIDSTLQNGQDLINSYLQENMILQEQSSDHIDRF
ncbi:MAG: extracellular solute-binding protein [Planctomycetota bacterium]